MDTGSFPGVKSGRGVTLTSHPLLVPWSRKSRAIPLLPRWAVRPAQSFSACTRVHFTFTFHWPYCLRDTLLFIVKQGVDISFFFMAQQPLVGQGLLITEASRSQSDTSQSIRLLWTSDRPDAETCTFTTQKTHKRQTPMTPAGFEPAIPASDRPQNHALERATTAIGGIVK